MMKKRIIFSLFCGLFVAVTFGQKQALDTGVLYHWPYVEQGSLSPDGQYAGYVIREEPANGLTLVLKTVKSGWERRFVNAAGLVYSKDSHVAIFLREHDTLTLLSLEKGEQTDIPQVNSFQLFDRDGEQFLLYAAKDNARHLVIRALCTGKEIAFAGVEAWLLAQNGRIMLTRGPRNTGKGIDEIVRTNLLTSEQQILWEGHGIQSWLIDSSGNQIAFAAKTQQGDNSLWYYKTGDERARLVARDPIAGIDSGLAIGRLISFCSSGSRLLLTLQQKELPKADPLAVAVDVWSYRDAKLQSQQLLEKRTARERGFMATLQLDSEFHLLQLQRQGEQPLLSMRAEEYLVFDSTQGDRDEQPWSEAAQPRYEIVSLRTGERRTVQQQVLSLSPAGTFLVLLAPGTRDISTYELSTGKIRPLTAGLALPATDQYLDDATGLKRHYINLVGWLPGDRKVILYDLNDVWEMDPLGAVAPLNLTHRYGRTHHILFRPALRTSGEVIGEGPLLLSAFDEETKANGFCEVPLHRELDPILPAQGSWLYYTPFTFHGEPVSRATQAPVYLVRREEASQSPNYFVTRDMKTFVPISEVYPERAYRWLTSRLLSFDTEDGRREKGILYLPDGFDSSKPYPAIIHYYERRSDELHLYPSVAGNRGNLNIAWFVSHGYIVFVPDIHYILGKAGEGVLQTVEGAAHFLKALAGVKVGKIALQGHSYGGWETNYLITHSQAFAAAMSNAGPTDWISIYGNLWGYGSSQNSFVENVQGRMGATLWEHPEYYIRNSPIFSADKVSTPILLVSNHLDHNVDFNQGLAFFTALRRLGKSAWMLQYDHGDHGESGRERQDCLLRSTQFFDHYLKGAPAPKWMVEGIPASKKQVDDGLELEPAGVEPGPGLLTPDAQKKVDALKYKKPITVTFN
jgi:dipeptidyl aminopeptidase/acylaminoacyl peptidase